MKHLKGFTVIISFILALSFTPIASAHSGRTDSSGGHHDYRNRSGLGGYHYHHGYPAHLHRGGVCPYDPKDTITLNSYKSTMYVGNNQRISYKIKSVSDDSYGSIHSSNSKIVKVIGNELIAKRAGTATITIKSYNNSKQFTITVKSVDVKNIGLSEKSLRLQVGDKKRIYATVKPSNATDKSIKWTSSNKKIATVNNGEIKAIKNGVTTIKATSSNGISKKVKVKVYSINPNSIETTSDNLKIEITDNSSINFTISPFNSNNKTYTISVKDDNIININEKSGIIEITPIKEGNTEISIKTWNGIEKIIPVEIYSIPLENIKIDDSNVNYIISNYVDKSQSVINLRCILSPEQCTYKDVIWTTSDEEVISISLHDLFTITGTGKVTLTCMSYNNNEILDTIDFVVIDKNDITTIVIVSIGSICFLIIIIKYRISTKRN